MVKLPLGTLAGRSCWPAELERRGRHFSATGEEVSARPRLELKPTAQDLALAGIHAGLCRTLLAQMVEFACTVRISLTS